VGPFSTVFLLLVGIPKEMTPQRFTSSHPFPPHLYNKLSSRTMIISLQRRCGVVTLRTVQVVLKVFLTLAACYFFVAWPPLHWFYDAASPAGPLSVYIPGASSHLRVLVSAIIVFPFLIIMHFPTTCTRTILGGGFSGFWFHLGYLQSMKNLDEYDYYCFSSGCLGAYRSVHTKL
jgi:hypothetical protein